MCSWFLCVGEDGVVSKGFFLLYINVSVFGDIGFFLCVFFFFVMIFKVWFEGFGVVWMVVIGGVFVGLFFIYFVIVVLVFFVWSLLGVVGVEGFLLDG